MRWFTCTPVPFGGGPDFFARDSGLLSRGFRLNGVESMAVMPGEGKPEDEADLIRTDYKNLESADWWSTHDLDGVVLYAWGKPGFRKVAEAIRASGAILVLNQDSSGMITPLAGPSGWLREQWSLNGGANSLTTLTSYFFNVAKGLTWGLLRTDPLRAMHLRQGHRIAALYPDAAECYRKICRIYGGAELASRVVTVPHAVTPSLSYKGSDTAKENRIIAIGRWDDVIQKRPQLLMDTLAIVLAEDLDVAVDIVGAGTERFVTWLAALAPKTAARITIHGRLTHANLGNLLLRSRIYHCPSAYESFNIAAAEALCCGCSVVSSDTPTMASFRWFVSEGCGMLADTDNSTGHAHAILAELSHWNSGRRNPVDISSRWTQILHADKVAANVLELTKKDQCPQ
ncbi:MAG: glycosyltransferase family 4 protein [Luteolibacter sp.]